MIIFKLNTFPNYSETFIVNNIIYTLKKRLSILIFVNKFLGISNSSQKEKLKQININEQLITPKSISNYTLKEILLLFVFIFNPKILIRIVSKHLLFSKNGLKIILKIFEHRIFMKLYICHVHYNYALDTLLEMDKFNCIKSKFIITFHGHDVFIENSKSFKKKYSKFYKKHVKYVTVNSDYLKKKIIELGVSESIIKIIPIGIDINFFKGAKKKLNNKKTIEILSIGRLVQLKGHVYGIQAVSELVKDGYNINYTIIGEGKEAKSLNNLINKLKLKDNIKLVGKKSQLEIKYYLDISDIFLMPSTYDNKNKRREAFGLSSIEAQAMGVPVVGFNSGGFPETILNYKTGFIVEDRNSKAMANKIKYLINNPNIYNNFSIACIKHANKFDNQYTTEKYVRIYKELLLNP